MCWGSAPTNWDDLGLIFPTIDLHLDGGVVLHLPPFRYLFMLRKGAYCLGEGRTRRGEGAMGGWVSCGGAGPGSGAAQAWTAVAASIQAPRQGRETGSAEVGRWLLVCWTAGMFDNGDSGGLIGGIAVRNVLVQVSRHGVCDLCCFEHTASWPGVLCHVRQQAWLCSAVQGRPVVLSVSDCALWRSRRELRRVELCGAPPPPPPPAAPQYDLAQQRVGFAEADCPRIGAAAPQHTVGWREGCLCACSAARP